MTADHEELRLPQVSEIIAILTVPAAPDLFPLGDCEEQEFRHLLATSPGVPIPPEARPILIVDPPAELRSRLAELVSDLRAEKQALREQAPELYGVLHGTLALAYQELARRYPLPHLLHAISLYEHVLGVFTREAFPEQWAMTQNNLGIAYRNLPTGDRGRNLEAAIACFQAALRVYTEADFPQDWAMTQNNLGAAYHELPTGDRGRNLKVAIACYDAALCVYTEADFPQDWAMIQNNLGNAYCNRPTGDRGGNLKKAIACYRAALRVRTEADFPQDWAMTQNNLGIAYRNLPTGDRDRNLKKAIACYRAALRVRTEADISQQWATTQNNLGEAYRNRPTGDRGGNLKKAIACYRAALRVRTEAAFPQDWAMTQNNLGIAYYELPTGDRGRNLKKAIACYRAALRVYTEADFPQDWAMTQNNLGNAYSALPTGDRGGNLERAIACYQDALRVRTEADFPQDWAMTQNNLGNAYRHLPTGDRGGNLERAIACYQDAYRGFERVGAADYLQQVSYHAGRIYEDEFDDLSSAYEWYRRSMDHFDHIRAGLISREYKEVFQGERLAVFRRAVRVMLELARRDSGGKQPAPLWRQAFEAADGAKSRILYEMVSKPTGTAEEADARSAPGGNIGSSLARRVSLEELVEEVLEPGTALVEYEVLPDGRCAVFAAAARKGLLGEPLLLPYQPAVDQVLALQRARETIGTGLAGLHGAAYDTFLNRTRGKYDRCLADLRAVTLPDPLLEALRRHDVQRLVVVPDHALHWVPFHALADVSDSERVSYLCDTMKVCYAPQVGVYAQMRKLAGQRRPGPGVVASGPDNPWEPGSLATEDAFYRDCQEFNDQILERLRRLFAARGTLLPRPTPEDFRDAVPRAALIHFFGHGAFGFRSDGPDPGRGEEEVRLQGEAKLFFWQNSLSNRDIHGWDRAVKLKHCAILTLAACWVGQADFLSKQAAREVMGLTAALFEREVPALVSALWPAQVGAALEFFERFYHHFAPATGKGLGRLDAFDQAQKDLRADPAFSHPYLWAPFHLVGADN